LGFADLGQPRDTSRRIFTIGLTVPLVSLFSEPYVLKAKESLIGQDLHWFRAAWEEC
jgi:hypothetical protein